MVVRCFCRYGEPGLWHLGVEAFGLAASSAEGFFRTFLGDVCTDFDMYCPPFYTACVFLYTQGCLLCPAALKKEAAPAGVSFFVPDFFHSVPDRQDAGKLQVWAIFKSIPMEKTLISWLNIFLGCTIMAAGFVFFINPYNIVPGGVYGASIVLHNLFPSIQVGTFGYMFDIPLLIISVVALGAKLGIRTIAAALSTPLIMNALTWMVYPNKEALQALDPTQLLGGTMNMNEHLMLTTIIGSTVIGLGQGIVVRNQATTGGTDIVAMILQKFAHIKFSNAILLVDGMVVGFGLVVIGFGIGLAEDSTQPSWHLSFYSLISIFICSRVLARVINGAKNDKLLFVISEQRLDSLHDYILKDLDRTATCIKSSGLYTGADKEMIFLVVSYKEVAGVKLTIKQADPRAFVVVTDAYDTFGEGWKQLPDQDEVQPE